MTANDGHQNGFTLVEVMVVLILLTLSFMVFLNALNTGKSVRARSELRTIQSVIPNSVENQIRARRFDENVSPPWSSSLGKETSRERSAWMTLTTLMILMDTQFHLWITSRI